MGRIGDARGWLSGWLERSDLVVLTVVGLVAALCWAFLEAADAVTGPGRTDARILRSLREPDAAADPLGPQWLEEAARDATALGGQAVLTLLVGSVLGFLAIARHRHAAVARAACRRPATATRRPLPPRRVRCDDDDDDDEKDRRRRNRGGTPRLSFSFARLRQSHTPFPAHFGSHSSKRLPSGSVAQPKRP